VKHPSLAVRNLVAGYGRREIVAISDLSFSSGTITALVGPNAAGKSTLIRALAGALKPIRGTVTLDGVDVHRMPAADRARRLAYLSQQSDDQFAFTVRELVTLGSEANRVAGRTAVVRTAQAIDWLDLARIADRDLLSLSGGERQRAGIARALAQETSLLLLDEPTAHLDLRHQAALMEALRHVARNSDATVILVLHDLNLAGAFADRILLLASGAIAADGPPIDVFNPSVIEAVYQTKVVQVGTVTGQNHFIHIEPQVVNPADPLV
jgi:iron complex transport system ATP-binding protein